MNVFNGIVHMIRGLFAEVNKQAIIVFGNQKSGTTAIAALLVELSGLSSTLDIRTWRVKEQDDLHTGHLLFEDFVNNHKHEFSKELIKEPALTLLYSDVARFFPNSKKVFIVRDPRDNIRSILNRVNRRGDKQAIENFEALPVAWQRIIDNRWLGLGHTHYIDSMAARWNHVTDVYLTHVDEMILVKYEDFLVDKVESISTLAYKLGLPQKNDIVSKVDIQYQPRGNQSVSWEDFFGLSNLERIERICGSRMALFDYKPLLSHNVKNEPFI